MEHLLGVLYATRRYERPSFDSSRETEAVTNIRGNPGTEGSESPSPSRNSTPWLSPPNAAPVNQLKGASVAGHTRNVENCGASLRSDEPESTCAPQPSTCHNARTISSHSSSVPARLMRLAPLQPGPCVPTRDLEGKFVLVFLPAPQESLPHSLGAVASGTICAAAKSGITAASSVSTITVPSIGNGTTLGVRTTVPPLSSSLIVSPPDEDERDTVRRKLFMFYCLLLWSLKRERGVHGRKGATSHCDLCRNLSSVPVAVLEVAYSTTPLLTMPPSPVSRVEATNTTTQVANSRNPLGIPAVSPITSSSPGGSASMTNTLCHGTSFISGEEGATLSVPCVSTTLQSQKQNTTVAPTGWIGPMDSTLVSTENQERLGTQSLPRPLAFSNDVLSNPFYGGWFNVESNDAYRGIVQRYGVTSWPAVLLLDPFGNLVTCDALSVIEMELEAYMQVVSPTLQQERQFSDLLQPPVVHVHNKSLPENEFAMTPDRRLSLPDKQKRMAPRGGAPKRMGRPNTALGRTPSLHLSVFYEPVCASQGEAMVCRTEHSGEESVSPEEGEVHNMSLSADDPKLPTAEPTPARPIFSNLKTFGRLDRDQSWVSLPDGLHSEVVNMTSLPQPLPYHNSDSSCDSAGHQSVSRRVNRSAENDDNQENLGAPDGAGRVLNIYSPRFHAAKTFQSGFPWCNFSADTLRVPSHSFGIADATKPTVAETGMGMILGVQAGSSACARRGSNDAASGLLFAASTADRLASDGACDDPSNTTGSVSSDTFSPCGAVVDSLGGNVMHYLMQFAVPIHEMMDDLDTSQPDRQDLTVPADCVDGIAGLADERHQLQESAQTPTRGPSAVSHEHCALHGGAGPQPRCQSVSRGIDSQAMATKFAHLTHLILCFGSGWHPAVRTTLMQLRRLQECVNDGLVETYRQSVHTSHEGNEREGHIDPLPRCSMALDGYTREERTFQRDCGDGCQGIPSEPAGTPTAPSVRCDSAYDMKEHVYKRVQIVYISADDSPSELRSTLAEMPSSWLCISSFACGFAGRRCMIVEQLMRTFGVDVFPRVVVAALHFPTQSSPIVANEKMAHGCTFLPSEGGLMVVQRYGERELTKDPDGKRFPWRNEDRKLDTPEGNVLLVNEVSRRSSRRVTLDSATGVKELTASLGHSNTPTHGGATTCCWSHAICHPLRPFTNSGSDLSSLLERGGCFFVLCAMGPVSARLHKECVVALDNVRQWCYEEMEARRQRVWGETKPTAEPANRGVLSNSASLCRSSPPSTPHGAHRKRDSSLVKEEVVFPCFEKTQLMLSVPPISSATSGMLSSVNDSAKLAHVAVGEEAKSCGNIPWPNVYFYDAIFPSMHGQTTEMAKEGSLQGCKSDADTIDWGNITARREGSCEYGLQGNDKASLTRRTVELFGHSDGLFTLPGDTVCTEPRWCDAKYMEELTHNSEEDRRKQRDDLSLLQEYIIAPILQEDERQFPPHQGEVFLACVHLPQHKTAVLRRKFLSEEQESAVVAGPVNRGAQNVTSSSSPQPPVTPGVSASNFSPSLPGASSLSRSPAGWTCKSSSGPSPLVSGTDTDAVVSGSCPPIDGLAREETSTAPVTATTSGGFHSAATSLVNTMRTELTAKEISPEPNHAPLNSVEAIKQFVYENLFVLMD